MPRASSRIHVIFIKIAKERGRKGKKGNTEESWKDKSTFTTRETCKPSSKTKCDPQYVSVPLICGTQSVV